MNKIEYAYNNIKCIHCGKPAELDNPIMLPIDIGFDNDAEIEIHIKNYSPRENESTTVFGLCKQCLKDAMMNYIDPQGAHERRIRSILSGKG
jgi:hypothetical protein